jgi:hypothetical protein
MGDRLLEWTDLEDRCGWETLVVGNGLSINIWRDFAYSRLFEQATLDRAARRLFSDFDTQNFETVLEALWHAEKTLSALGRQIDAVTKLYEKVQSALFQAVRQVHVPWRRIDRPRLQHISDAMRSYRFVFTLNYDLLTYWAAMQRGANLAIRDFFWSDDNTFDISDATLAEDTTGLLYLHGGIHLWQDSKSGRTGKWTTKRGSGVTLLTSLEASVSSIPSRRPLFVSEGTSAQKMAVIRRSDYLTYALQTLSDNTSDTSHIRRQLRRPRQTHRHCDRFGSKTTHRDLDTSGSSGPKRSRDCQLPCQASSTPAVVLRQHLPPIGRSVVDRLLAMGASLEHAHDVEDLEVEIDVERGPMARVCPSGRRLSTTWRQPRLEGRAASSNAAIGLRRVCTPIRSQIGTNAASCNAHATALCRRFPHGLCGELSGPHLVEPRPSHVWWFLCA